MVVAGGAVLGAEGQSLLRVSVGLAACSACGQHGSVRVAQVEVGALRTARHSVPEAAHPAHYLHGALQGWRIASMIDLGNSLNSSRNKTPR